MAELSTIARPYADAAFSRAVEQNNIEDWANGLTLLAAVVENETMAEALDNPNINQADKIDLITSVASEDFNKEVKNFVVILAENERLDVLPEIQLAFNDLKVEHEGRVDVEITSAFAVTDEQLQLLSISLKKRLGKEVNIVTTEDSSLIGGLVIQAGDLVIDGSVKSKLNQMAIDLGI
ncbi:MAG: F0F1 ATP synthase subunit delta [Methylococcales bacterium]|jgi:F-type H+-transporting ATPase subunit delta|nr:F0F1 ATP synthase subunit delta [Methylococcales bacterium]